MYWLETKRRAWAGDIASLGAYIDNLMGDVDAITDHNRSYVKLYLGMRASKYDDLETLLRMRFSLDLPITKKRFRFVLESDGEDEIDLLLRDEENVSEQAPSDDGVAASFRYLYDSSHWRRLSFDWGLKARIEPDLFSRVRGVRAWSVSEDWSFTYSQELFWYDSKGAGAQASFDFDRLVKRAYLFRISSRVSWYERKGEVGYLEQLSFFHDVNEHRAVEYAVGVAAGEEDHHTVVSEYFAKVRYRRNLYKGWLFYELSTGVTFPRVYDYNTNPFFGLRLEVLLSNDAGKVLSTRLY